VPTTPLDRAKRKSSAYIPFKRTVFGTKPGIDRATIARGVWGLIGPLTPGAHTVHIQAQGPLFGLDVTYTHKVVAPSN
jgi:hypothetical protein